jgi:pimeloyl-ACP methyl ester carboxylesterase
VINAKTPRHKDTKDEIRAPEAGFLQDTRFLKSSPSGVPYLDWGGLGPVLHFAHANGFPPGTYSSFVARLTDRFHVLGCESRPLWGTQDSRTDGGVEHRAAQFRHWRELAGDLARFLSEMGLRGIIGAGHSLGAVTTLYCAAANPGLFRALVLIDPVIIPAYMAPIVAVAKWLHLTSRTRLPRGARRRQVDWPNREVLFRAYRAAPVFARWQEPFLRDYVASGTVQEPAGGVRLRYPPEWEARIFETVPADVWLAIPRLRHIPLLVVRGEHSGTYRRDTMRLMRWLLPQGRFLEIAGADHFVPMSQPEETVAAIKAFLSPLVAE